MNETIVILALLAGLVTLQYWRGRKLNLAFIRGISNELEKVIKPLDGEYTWIGGYVGVIAQYTINSDKYNEIQTTISLLPRHSLLYFPISFIMGRRDRVYFMIKPRKKIKYDFHLKTGKRADTPGNVSNFKKDEAVINDTELKYWYNDREVVPLLTQITSKMKDPSNLKHLTVNREENAYYAEVVITDNAPVSFIKAFMQVMG
ncbi:MAG: hypothetical protein ACOCQN_00515 [Halanaerobiaceae bacterium]